MEEENNRSSLEEMPETHPKPQDDEDEDFQVEKFERNVEHKRVRGKFSTRERGESTASQSEILISLQKIDYSEIPVEYSLQQPMQSVRKVKVLIMPYYLVTWGRKCGIFNTWDECEAQIKYYPSARSGFNICTTLAISVTHSTIHSDM